MAKAWQLSSDRALALGSLPDEVLAQESWWLASWPIVAEKRVDDRWLCCASTLWRWGSTEARWLDSLLCRRDLSASCVFSSVSQWMCPCRILYPKTLNIKAGCQWWRWSLWCQMDDKAILYFQHSKCSERAQDRQVLVDKTVRCSY